MTYDTQKTDLSKMRSGIGCEDDLQEYIATGMKRNGWTALREVNTSFNDYRADIIGHRNDIGTVGIECKYVTGGPIVAAEAARQIIERYAGEKFVKWRVDMWGVCLFGRAFSPSDNRDTDSRYRDGIDRGEIAACKRILNGLGIGFTTGYADRVMIEFLPSGGDVKIPLFQIDGEISPRYAEKFDRNRVLELIAERRPEGNP